MAALAETAPTLELDTEKLREWGYIWRAGTKVRKKGKTAEIEGPDDPDAENEDAMADGETAPADHRLVLPTPAEAIGVPDDVLRRFDPAKKYPAAFDKKQGMDFGLLFDKAVGEALATMLGNTPPRVFTGRKRTENLLPPKNDCVEVGPVRVIGGIRPQNFDVGYRPDGIRIAFDSKTLNDAGSIPKNWQNMVNDLSTEATTVHTRFPYAIVALMVVIPRPALKPTQQADLIRTLERLATRRGVINQDHLAEAIALIVWNPVTGEIDPYAPASGSPLRYESFMPAIFERYVERYKGLPPHDK